MPSLTKEAGFPADYREAQVRQVMRAVYRLRSIAITGLAGMGKSNLVRFILSPQVRPCYLKDRANDFAFVHVDCAGLDTSDEAKILDEIRAQLRQGGLSQRTRHSLPNPSGLRRALQDQILHLNAALNLVVVIDYFDEAAMALTKPFYNYLFHLRNARPRGNLSYIFVTRRPIASLSELQELLDDECVVGPLSRKDALESLRRDEARLGFVFSAWQRDELFAWSGGHPGLLKNAAELLADGRLDFDLPGEVIERQLLSSQKIRNLCQELWSDLTLPEQAVVIKATRGMALSRAEDSTGALLEQHGILSRKGDKQGHAGQVIFCPVFEAFVRHQSGTGGSIRISAAFPDQARIETPIGEETIRLSPKLFALLKALAEAQGRTLPVDHLVAEVYGAEAPGVTDAGLSQLVKRLRGTLDPRVRKMTGDCAYTCVETVRGVGYRFIC